MSLIAGLALGADAKKLVTPEMVESIGAETFSLKAIEAQYSLAASDVINRLIPILNGRTFFDRCPLFRQLGCALSSSQVFLLVLLHTDALLSCYLRLTDAVLASCLLFACCCSVYSCFLLVAFHFTVGCTQVRTRAHLLSFARTLAPPSRLRKTQARSAASTRPWSLFCSSLPAWCRCSSTTYVTVSGGQLCYLVCLCIIRVSARSSHGLYSCPGDVLTASADVFLLLEHVDVSLLPWSGLAPFSVHARSGMSRTTKSTLWSCCGGLFQAARFTRSAQAAFMRLPACVYRWIACQKSCR